MKNEKALEATAPRSPVTKPLGACKPERYGQHGVMFCPRGCVTQCEQERREA